MNESTPQLSISQSIHTNIIPAQVIRHGDRLFMGAYSLIAFLKLPQVNGPCSVSSPSNANKLQALIS